MNKNTTIKNGIAEPEEARRGALIREVLGLRKSRDNPTVVNTTWGTKTDIGLFRVMQRLVIDGE
jgi:hypothetical protein